MKTKTKAKPRTRRRGAKKTSPPARVYRFYPDEFRATVFAALDANDGNVLRTARQLGVPETTIRRWIAGARPVSAEMREQKRETLAVCIENYARRMCEEPIGEHNPAVALGIAVDKLLLLTDRPNSFAKTVGGEGGPVDITAAIANLTRPELEQLVQLHAKLRGQQPLRLASDPSNPVVVDDGEDTQ